MPAIIALFTNVSRRFEVPSDPGGKQSAGNTGNPPGKAQDVVVHRAEILLY
jgi:hypothetical protein